MTWIKICGITNLEDARAALDAGADAVGFVFYDKSPRRVSVETASSVARQLPANVEKVGVLVDQSQASILDVAEHAGLTAVQLHGGDEDPHVADLVARQRPDLKLLAAISMRGAHPQDQATKWSPQSVYAFLLDSGTSSQLGGTGTSFDWKAARPQAEVIGALGRVIVAGGLNPQNVAEAIRVLKPWGVDVSSGVEASPGKKDHEKLRAFIRAVRRAERN